MARSQTMRWFMARDFALSFYKSPAWLRNRKAYMSLPVDLNGQIVHVKDTDDGPAYYRLDEYGYEVPVNIDNVVPAFMCERCYANGVLKPAKVVHHIVHLNPENIDDPSVTLAYANFQRLCQDCHAAVHSSAPESRVRFAPDGTVIWK